MKTTHTAGNWHAHDGQIYPEQTGKTLALIPYFDKGNEEMQANARIIAAAPDMMEALNETLTALKAIAADYPEDTYWNEVIQKAEEAIQKATQP